MTFSRVVLAGLVCAALAGCGGSAGVVATAAADPPPPVSVTISGPGTYPAGDYVVSASLPPGVYIGAGPTTRIIAAPGGAFNLFAGAGAVTLRNLALVGNGLGAEYASGSAVALTAGDIVLDHVTLDNFHASYWVYTEGAGSVTATGITATSYPGNVAEVPNEGGHSSYVLGVIGSGTLDVEDSTMALDWIKGGAALFGPGQLVSKRNVFKHCGVSLPDTDPRAVYCLLAYRYPYVGLTAAEAEANRPLLLRSEGDLFDGSSLSGIYTAAAIRVEVPSGEFRDMPHPNNGPLPVGCIALNEPDVVDIGPALKFHACVGQVLIEDLVRGYIFRYPESP